VYIYRSYYKNKFGGHFLGHPVYSCCLRWAWISRLMILLHVWFVGILWFMVWYGLVAQ